jgi:hypothetical protein
MLLHDFLLQGLVQDLEVSGEDADCQLGAVESGVRDQALAVVILDPLLRLLLDAGNDEGGGDLALDHGVAVAVVGIGLGRRALEAGDVDGVEADAVDEVLGADHVHEGFLLARLQKSPGRGRTSQGLRGHYPAVTVRPPGSGRGREAGPRTG